MLWLNYRLSCSILRSRLPSSAGSPQITWPYSVATHSPVGLGEKTRLALSPQGVHCSSLSRSPRGQPRSTPMPGVLCCSSLGSYNLLLAPPLLVISLAQVGLPKVLGRGPEELREECTLLYSSAGRDQGVAHLSLPFHSVEAGTALDLRAAGSCLGSLKSPSSSCCEPFLTAPSLGLAVGPPGEGSGCFLPP